MSSCEWTPSVSSVVSLYEDCKWSDTEEDATESCGHDEPSEHSTEWDLWENVEWSSDSECTSDNVFSMPHHLNPSLLKKSSNSEA